MKKRNSAKGIIFLFTAAIVWGFAFSAQRVGADSVTPFLFDGLRFALGALSLIPVILIFEKGADDKDKLKRTLIVGAIAGIVLFAASNTQLRGIHMTNSAGKSGFITGLYMIIVPFFGVFLGKKTTLRTWISAVLGVAGLFFICMGGGTFDITKGDILLIICAVLYAVHILVVDRFGADVYSIRFSQVQFTVCSLCNLISVFFFESFDFSGVGQAIIPLLYCGIGSVGVAYTSQILGQKYSEPTSAAIIMSTESLFSAIGGALLLGERMTPVAILGCVLIMGGIILSQLGGRDSDS